MRILAASVIPGLAINRAARRKASARTGAALTIAALACLFGGGMAAPPAGASPGPWVAFQTSLRDGQFGDEGVFLVRPDGSGQHEVATAIPGEHIHPDWSSDGHTLVFAGLAGDRHQIIRFDPLGDPTGAHARQLTACAGSCLDDNDPALSPDDTKIAYLRIGGPLVTIGQVEMPATQKLQIAAVTAGGLTQVQTIFQTTTTTELNAPRWSPDGSHLVFWTDHVNPDSGQVDATAVFTIRADGTHLQQVTPQSMLAGECDWSPDGTRLVFATHPLGGFNFVPVVSNLFIVRPDGTELRQLTNSTTPNDRATQAHFTPDGRIIYTRVTPGGRTLWLIDADGSKASPIPASGQRIRTHGDWQPTA
jgi:Tol biopolymer transport system component